MKKKNFEKHCKINYSKFLFNSSKKGAIMHFVVFIIFAGIATFLLLNLRSGEGLQTKGAWQTETYQVFLEKEKNLMIQDFKIEKIVNDKLGSFFSKDLGCGINSKVPMLNKNDKWCSLTFNNNNVLKEINTNLKHEFGREYDLKIDNNDLIGISKIKLNIKKKVQSIFMIKRPFYLSYSYYPNFRVKFPQNSLRKLEQDSRLLVETCQKENNLQECVKKKPNNWFLGNCYEDDYIENNRIVLFCEKNLKIKFFLDFSPKQPFEVRNLIATFENNKLRLEFDKSSADLYKVYYTDWPNFRLPNNPNDLFSSMTSAYQKKELTIIPSNVCPDVKQDNIGYTCDDKIMYIFMPEKLSYQNKYVAVTIVKENKESQIKEFKQYS